MTIASQHYILGRGHSCSIFCSTTTTNIIDINNCNNITTVTHTFAKAMAGNSTAAGQTYFSPGPGRHLKGTY